MKKILIINVKATIKTGKELPMKKGKNVKRVGKQTVISGNRSFRRKTIMNAVLHHCKIVRDQCFAIGL